MQPRYIRNPAELDAAVTIGTTTEDIVLDFKRTINGWRVPKGTPAHVKAEAQKETCRDLAQFANTYGGCILIGVAERRDPATNLNVADGIQSVADPDAMTHWIEEAVRNYLVPATFSRDIAIVNHPSGTVLSVNVQPSIHLITLWDSQQHTIECVRRTSYGKDWMNPDELERHIMNGSRATKLAFELALNHATKRDVLVGGGYWRFPPNPGRSDIYSRWNPKGPTTLGHVGEYWFELEIPYGAGSATVNLPYGVVEHVWVDADGQLNLLLSTRVVVRGDQFTVEPGV